MSLVYYSAVSTSDYQLGERGIVAYLESSPSVGDRLSLGSSHRLWTIVDCDYYQSSETSEGIWLAHCDLQLGRDRSQWFAVQQMAKRQAPSLWLYLGQDALIQRTVDFMGRSPVVGKLVPRYNTADHTVSSWAWGVERVITYVPTAGVDLPCYQTVRVAHCVYVPEVAEAPSTSLTLTR